MPVKTNKNRQLGGGLPRTKRCSGAPLDWDVPHPKPQKEPVRLAEISYTPAGGGQLPPQLTVGPYLIVTALALAVDTLGEPAISPSACVYSKRARGRSKERQSGPLIFNRRLSTLGIFFQQMKQDRLAT